MAGDGTFLILVGISATLAMHLAHCLAWPFLLMSLSGMLAGMLVQTAMALCMAPLLGSIETMVPSMIVAMTSPMSLCVLHLLGYESNWPIAAMIGGTFGAAIFGFVQSYGRRCRRLCLAAR